MTLGPDDIPAEFWIVPYASDRVPVKKDHDLSRGANCQRFAYALLAHFGRYLPPFRSSELWDDATYTLHAAAPFAPLDLLLFAAEQRPWGAHVAVVTGPDTAIHLSRRVGRPAIWSLARFGEEADYWVLLGAERVR